MIGILFGALLIAFAAYVGFYSVREFRAGIAKFNFKWTYPRLETSRFDEPVPFWLLTLAKLLIVVASGYVGVSMVLTQ
jgi:hypothetical protein